MPPLAHRQLDLNRVPCLSRSQSVVQEHAINAVRWAPGERLDHLLEEACIRFATNDAVIGSGIVLSFHDLNCRANQLARHLLSRGIKSGDRVAMMFDRSPETYVAMLAVMKVNAAYVPLDVSFPIERIRFILEDANASAIVSMSSLAKRLSGLQDRRAHAVEKDEGADETPLPGRQRTTHGKAANVAGAGNDEVLDGVAGKSVARDGIVAGKEGHILLLVSSNGSLSQLMVRGSIGISNAVFVRR